MSRPAGSFPNEHGSRVCELLQPSRDVDRVSAHHELAPGCCISAGDDFACIDANAERDLGTVMALADRGCERRKRLLHGKGGAHRSLRVVFVGLGYPEDGQDGIAHELLADAAEALHLRVHESEQLALERSHVLGVEPLAERRRPGEVGEKHGDYSPLFLLRARVGPLRAALQDSSARRAESGRRGLLRSARRAGLEQICSADMAEPPSFRGLRAARDARERHAASLDLRLRGEGSSRVPPPPSVELGGLNGVDFFEGRPSIPAWSVLGARACLL